MSTSWTITSLTISGQSASSDNLVSKTGTMRSDRSEAGRERQVRLLMKTAKPKILAAKETGGSGQEASEETPEKVEGQRKKGRHFDTPTALSSGSEAKGSGADSTRRAPILESFPVDRPEANQMSWRQCVDR